MTTLRYAKVNNEDSAWKFTEKKIGEKDEKIFKCLYKDAQRFCKLNMDLSA